MKKSTAVVLSIASFVAGALTGGASMFFYMKKKYKKEIDDAVYEKVDKVMKDYQYIGDNEVDTITKNNLPNKLKEDQERFEEEFNSEQAKEPTPFKGKHKERHRRVQSLFKDYKPLTPEEKGAPEVFHPEDEEDKKRYYGPNFPREQDINEGTEENIDYMSNEQDPLDAHQDYDEDIDSDLIERDQNGIPVPYTLTKEEFDDCYENNTMFEKETLYWYEGNGTLVQNDRHLYEDFDSSEEMIIQDDDKILETIGDASERFGENEDEPDVVYVKNDDLCMLYKVIRMDEEYNPN